MVRSKSGVPRGYQAVMPYLRVRDAVNAIKFYKRAFGATENFRLKMPGGKLGHAELNFGGAVIMLSDEFPEHKAVGPRTLKGTSVTIALYVADVDKAMTKAVKAGAKVRMAAMDQFYGDRSGQVEDPYGHVWSIQSRIEKVAPKEMQKRLTAMLRSPKPTKIKAVRGKAIAKPKRASNTALRSKPRTKRSRA